MPSLQPATVNKIILLIYKYYFITLFFAAGCNLCNVLPVDSLLMTKHVAIVSVL
jgi:hypothetical protein